MNIKQLKEAKELIGKYLELQNDSLSDYWRELLYLHQSQVNFKIYDGLSTAIEKEIMEQAKHIKENARIVHHEESVLQKWNEVEWDN